MPKISPIPARKLMRVFESAGFTCVRIEGDHYVVMEKYQPEAVLHFAGFAYVGESVQKPDKYYRNNVVGSLALLESRE